MPVSENVLSSEDKVSIRIETCNLLINHFNRKIKVTTCNIKREGYMEVILELKSIIKRYSTNEKS